MRPNKVIIRLDLVDLNLVLTTVAPFPGVAVAFPDVSAPVAVRIHVVLWRHAILWKGALGRRNADIAMRSPAVRDQVPRPGDNSQRSVPDLEPD